jgi:hypothetical protein
MKPKPFLPVMAFLLLFSCLLGSVLNALTSCTMQPPVPAPAPVPSPVPNVANVQLAVARFGAAAVEAAATAAAAKNAPALLAALDGDKSGTLSVAEILGANFNSPEVLAVAIAAAWELRK